VKRFLPALGLLALSGCADFGGPIGGNAPLSPQEARLQSLETRLGDVARKVENLSFAAQSQTLAKLDGEVRELRGEVERLRYEIETGEKRARELYQDLDKRMTRLENEGRARLSMEPRLAQPPPVPDVQEEEATYAAVFEQLKAAKYDDSIAGFRGLLERWPRGRYADNAWYWLGESHYAKKDYGAALESFRKLTAEFPDSAKMPDALFKIGLCQLERKEKSEARASWQRVVAEYPNSPAAGFARQRLEQTK
jgi:tol-pal system protein YbgF